MMLLAWIQTAAADGGLGLDLIPQGTSVAAVIAVVVLFLRRQNESESRLREAITTSDDRHAEARQSYERILEAHARVYQENLALIVAAHQRNEEAVARRLAEVVTGQSKLEAAIEKLADRMARLPCRYVQAEPEG